MEKTVRYAITSIVATFSNINFSHLKVFNGNLALNTFKRMYLRYLLWKIIIKSTPTQSPHLRSQQFERNLTALCVLLFLSETEMVSFQSCVKDLEAFGLRSAFYNKIECGGSCLHSQYWEGRQIESQYRLLSKTWSQIN